MILVLFYALNYYVPYITILLIKITTIVFNYCLNFCHIIYYILYMYLNNGYASTKSHILGIIILATSFQIESHI